MRKNLLPRSTILAIVAVLVLDRATKIWAAANLPYQVPVTVIPGLENIFTLTYIRNSGAAFGLFPQAATLFAIVKIVVVIGLVVWYNQLPVQHFLVRVAVGMIQGGAVGNLIDRLTTGSVVDFLHFHFWPIFNVADSAVSVGVVILAAYMLLDDSQAPARSKVEALGPDGPSRA